MAAIPCNSGTHVKARRFTTNIYGYLIRISAQHVCAFKPVMMAKMVDWLRTNDSEEYALWWEKYWAPAHDPRRGAITLADSSLIVDL